MHRADSRHIGVCITKLLAEVNNLIIQSTDLASEIGNLCALAGNLTGLGSGLGIECRDLTVGRGDLASLGPLQGLTQLMNVRLIARRLRASSATTARICSRSLTHARRRTRTGSISSLPDCAMRQRML